MTDLTIDDIAQVLERLTHDGLIEKVVSQSKLPSRIISDDEDDNIYVYKAVPLTTGESLLGSIPCGTCSVFDLCGDFGPITPVKCEYYTEWLAF